MDAYKAWLKGRTKGGGLCPVDRLWGKVIEVGKTNCSNKSKCDHNHCVYAQNVTILQLLLYV